MSDLNDSNGGEQGGSRFFRRGGFWVLCQAVLMFAAVGGGFLRSHAWDNGALRLCGLALLAVGALCGAAGALSLGRNLSPFPQPRSGVRLVQDGIYGVMRHPLYTAVFCGALGWALVMASWPALAAALCLAPFFDAKARTEERALRRKFPEYEQYQRRVKRFVPGLY